MQAPRGRQIGVRACAGTPLRKTGAASRAEATALAVRDGLLRPTAEDVERFVERAPGG